MSNYGPIGIESNKPLNKIYGKGVEIISVRVRDIVLSPNHPRFNEVGGWNGLGTVFFSSIENPGVKNVGSILGSARPYFSNSKFYPLVNEIVNIIKATNFVKSQSKSQRNSKLLYYFPPTNGWNAINHNALPDPLQSTPNTQFNKVYLGQTFKENPKVRALYPYEGDHILEGRWGNSIRFGSTVKSSDVFNNWSSEGKEGDPIIILKNGNLPFPSSDPSYVPIVEDINNDLSSIYLTSTQKIPFFPASLRVDSFGEGDSPSPISSEYQGNQILLTSGRLVLNAQSDGVLISSPNVIHLSSGDSIHMDCGDKIVLSSQKVYLGDRNAEERAVLGDQLVNNLKLLLEVLEGVGLALTDANADKVPVGSLNSIGPSLVAVVKDFKMVIKGDDPKILSKNIKLK